jgi:GNAT superfamily N-acetyltransferase
MSIKRTISNVKPINSIETIISKEEKVLIEANLLARFVYLSESEQMRFFVEPEISWFTTDIPYPNYLFNTVLRANFSTPEAAHTFINGLLGDAQARQMALYWFVGPATQPAQLGKILETHQFQHLLGLQCMKLDLANLNEAVPFPADFRVERVTRLNQLRDFVTVLARNSDMPATTVEAWFQLEAGLGIGDNLPLQRYLGFWRGEPVAACSLVSGAGVAGLYQVATLPHARGHGLATAISLTAMREARRLGHHTAILHSTPMALNVYRQLGFQPVANLDLYFWRNQEEGQK